MRRLLLYSSCLVLALLLVSLQFMGCRGTHLPGTDLSHFHPQSVPQHIEALRSQDATARKKAAGFLWQIGAEAKEATPALLQAATDLDPQVREEAVKALGRTGQGTQDAVPVLVGALADDHADVRAAAATSLAETWSAAKSPRRGRTPANPGAQGRSTPAQGPPSTRLPVPFQALARKAVPLLMSALRDPEARVRVQAIAALGETGPLAQPAVADLVSVLQTDSDNEARVQAVLALGNIGPDAEAAVPTLIDTLRSEKALGIRVNSAASLGLIHAHAETVVPALVEAHVTDPEPEVRTWSVFGLQQFGPQARLAIPALQELAKDPKHQQLPEFNDRVKRATEMLERMAKPSESPRTPGDSAERGS